MKKIGLVLLLILGNSQFATAKRAPKKAKAKVLEVESSIVQKGLKKELPKEICSPESQTIRCHRISRKTCLKIVKKDLGSCLKIHKVKKVLNYEESVGYGKKIGLCLKGEMDPKIKKFKKDCTEPTK